MADRTPGRKKISDEVLDELPAGQDAAEVFRSGTLIDDFLQRRRRRRLALLPRRVRRARTNRPS